MIHLRTLRVGLLIGAVVGLVGAPTGSVRANTTKTIEFVGTMMLSCGIGDPGINGTPNPNISTKPGPKGVPEGNIPPQGNHCGLDIDTTTCTKVSTGKKAGTHNCDLDADGSIWGFCGYATGEGFMVVQNLNDGKNVFFTLFKMTVTGGIARISGGDYEENIRGELTMVPTTGSCPNKTATGFTLKGTLHYKECTNGTVTVNGHPTGVCQP